MFNSSFFSFDSFFPVHHFGVDGFFNTTFDFSSFLVDDSLPFVSDSGSSVNCPSSLHSSVCYIIKHLDFTLNNYYIILPFLSSRYSELSGADLLNKIVLDSSRYFPRSFPSKYVITNSDTGFYISETGIKAFHHPSFSIKFSKSTSFIPFSYPSVCNYSVPGFSDGDFGVFGDFVRFRFCRLTPSSNFLPSENEVNDNT